MFMSNYLPVNMKRANCVIYSAEKTFPEERLVAAYSFITNHAVEGVFMQDGNVSFVDAPEINWTLPEIYLAYNAYRQAANNNFSYYEVKNESGTPQLFISKSFKNHRILVNAFTMQSVLLGNRQLVNKVASLIDKTASNAYCIDLFNTLQAIEHGNAKFLSALLIAKDTSDECLAVNPMITLMSDMTAFYGSDLIEEMRDIVVNGVEETESLKLVNNKYIRKEFMDSWSPMTIEHLEYVVDTYDKIKEKKSNYVPIYNSNSYEPELYFSTNNRYLVNAKTFECVVIKNQHTKSLLVDMVRRSYVPSGECILAWMLAKTE